MREVCCTLWIGSKLGAVERACLKSVIQQGHPMELYCYSLPEAVPNGVTVRDASEILPADQQILHQRGSPALFADRFRYELQRRGRGVWLDTDVYLLRPLPTTGPYLFGLQDDARINGAVLRIPADSVMLPRLLEVFDERLAPPWLPPRAKLAAWWRLRRTGRSGLAKMPWGVIGPDALTALAREYGVAGQALAQEVFYPVPPRSARWIIDPELPIERVVSARTVGVHLWNEAIRTFKDQPAPEGTFLKRLQTEGAIEP